MKNDILLKGVLLNGNERNFVDLRILFDIKTSQNVGVKKMASG